ncbi:MAG: hypothetical protein ACLSEY_00275 [Enterocloster sp.]
MIIGAHWRAGTKYGLAPGKKDGTIIEQVSIPTATPEETVPKDYRDVLKDKDIKALGIGALRATET